MASKNNNIKIHENLKVVPPHSTETSTTPLTFFDVLWLRLNPVERIFFYTLQNSQSHPSFFFENMVPKLKTSLSLTLQHFLPLAGKIIWPLDSPKPFIQFNPTNDDDGVSLFIAESSSDLDFNDIIENSPHDVSLSHSFVPHLESTNSFASIISIQITLFPKSGFSIGISSHHSVLDGKSSTMFIKAWAYLCNKIIETDDESSPPILLTKLEPFFDRTMIKDPNGLSDKFTNIWVEKMPKMFPNEKVNERSLKILPFKPKVGDYVRATFELTRENLNKIKQRVLSKWEILLDTNESMPQTLSSFVLTSAYSLVCVAKAIHEVEKEKEKFSFMLTFDCRARLEPQLPNNYFGNCVWGHAVDTKPLDFIQEDGVFLVAKSIHEKLKMINEIVFEGDDDNLLDKFTSLTSKGFEIMGVTGSNKFGVYETDFGWGRPEKVETVSIDRGGLSIGLVESKNGNGGIEVGLVLNKHVMDLFSTLFLQGLH